MNSRHQSAWVALFIAALLLAALAKQCSASITLHMTGGYIDMLDVNPGFTTTIFGNVSTGGHFVLQILGSGTGTINPVYHSIDEFGEPVSPNVLASDSDFLAFSFAINGTPIPLSGLSQTHGYSNMSISGPPAITLVVPVPHILFMPIKFDFNSVLYTVGGLVDEPDYVLSAKGTGLAELRVIPVADNTVYHVESAHYALVAAPELGAFAIWSILAFAAISYRRRLA